MEREIVFRGKRIDSDGWIYGDLEYNRARNIARIHTYDEDGEYLMQHLVEPESVGQFVGLTDKNGKEIYEGDIVRYIDCNDTISIDEVRYADAGFTPVCEIARMADIEGTECEVIGNRYDNPDLLNGK